MVMHAELFVPANNNMNMHRNYAHTFERLSGLCVQYCFRRNEYLNIEGLYVMVVLYYWFHKPLQEFRPHKNKNVLWVG